MKRRSRGKNKKSNNLAVLVGDVYRVPRENKRDFHICVIRILKRDPLQLKVKYALVTRSGNRKERKSAPDGIHWLQWRNGKWNLPESWVLVKRK